MKYIRTKDGVYSVYTNDLNPNDEIDRNIAGIRAKYCKGLNEPILKEDIVKVADTIEELCDEFVSVDNYENKSIGDDFEIAKAKYKILNAGAVKMLSGKIYGAIWTDKGLIYVAKMNDKGELELLW